MIGTILFWAIMLAVTVIVGMMHFGKHGDQLVEFFLKKMKLLSQRWHAFFNSAMAESYKRSVYQHKKDLFETMHQKLKQQDSKTAPVLLEIGVGPGTNLQFIPSDLKIQLVALEPNQFCKPYLDKTLSKHPHVTMKRYVESMAEDMKDISSNSVDCVLSTIVLCSVFDQTKVLAEIRRVLKPGGHYFFLEHVRAKQGSIMEFFQTWLNPVNNILLDGCNVNRLTLEKIQQAGFSELKHNTFDASLNYTFAMLRPHISGYALK